MTMSKTLEICTGDPVGIEAAIAGGADRIELCSGLAEGGLTPSIGAIRYAASRPVTVNVLIRPRPGDFVYSPREIELMVADIKEAVRCGADGIVVGALTATWIWMPAGGLSKPRKVAMPHSTAHSMYAAIRSRLSRMSYRWASTGF